MTMTCALQDRAIVLKAIASESTATSFRSGSGTVVWTAMRDWNGGEKESWPTTRGAVTSAMSRMTRPAAPPSRS